MIKSYFRSKKIDAEMDTKSNQIQIQKRSEIRFYRFRNDLEYVKFKQFLENEKVDRTSDKHLKFEVPK